jgi:hypothetical protein
VGAWQDAEAVVQCSCHGQQVVEKPPLQEVACNSRSTRYETTFRTAWPCSRGSLCPVLVPQE